MKSLNKVEVESTFRVKADSAIEAAEISVPRYHNVDSVSPVSFGGFPEDSVFIMTYKGAIRQVTIVVFVEEMGEGQYRVDYCGTRVSLSEIDVVWYIGGDEAVNKVGFYRESSGSGFEYISADKYDHEIAKWIDKDTEEGTPGRMEYYIRDKYTRVITVDGVVTEV